MSDLSPRELEDQLISLREATEDEMDAIDRDLADFAFAVVERRIGIEAPAVKVRITDPAMREEPKRHRLTNRLRRHRRSGRMSCPPAAGDDEKKDQRC